MEKALTLTHHGHLTTQSYQDAHEENVVWKYYQIQQQNSLSADNA